jgi:hypothetical protein
MSKRDTAPNPGGFSDEWREFLDGAGKTPPFQAPPMHPDAAGSAPTPPTDETAAEAEEQGRWSDALTLKFDAQARAYDRRDAAATDSNDEEGSDHE